MFADQKNNNKTQQIAEINTISVATDRRDKYNLAYSSQHKLQMIFNTQHKLQMIVSKSTRSIDHRNINLQRERIRVYQRYTHRQQQRKQNGERG